MKKKISNKETALKIVSQNGLMLRILSEEMRKERDVVLVAVRQNPLSIEFADVTLRSDEEVAVELLNQYPNDGIQYIDKQLLDDFSFIIYNITEEGFERYYLESGHDLGGTFNTSGDINVLLSLNPKFLSKMPDHIKGDPKIFIKCLKTYRETYQNDGEYFFDYLVEPFNNDADVMHQSYLIFPFNTIKSLGSELKKSEEFFLKIIGYYIDYNIYKFIPIEIKNERNFILNAINRNEDYAKYINHNLLRSVVFMQDILYKNPKLIIFSGANNLLPYSEFREKVLDRLLVLYIVATDGLLLEHLAEFSADREVVYIACRNNGLALQYADENLKDDIQMIKWAMKENPQAIWLIDECIQGHPDLLDV